MVVGMIHAARESVQQHWRAEHREREEQIAFERAAEERDSRSVGHHEPAESARIHLRERGPDSEVADQEK